MCEAFCPTTSGLRGIRSAELVCVVRLCAARDAHTAPAVPVETDDAAFPSACLLSIDTGVLLVMQGHAEPAPGGVMAARPVRGGATCQVAWTVGRQATPAAQSSLLTRPTTVVAARPPATLSPRPGAGTPAGAASDVPEPQKNAGDCSRTTTRSRPRDRPRTASTSPRTRLHPYPVRRHPDRSGPRSSRQQTLQRPPVSLTCASHRATQPQQGEPPPAVRPTYRIQFLKPIASIERSRIPGAAVVILSGGSTRFTFGGECVHKCARNARSG